MLDVLKEIFLPKVVVGLQADRHTVRAVQLSNPLGSPVIESIAVQDLPDEESSPGLESFLEKQKMSPELVITCIPAAAVLIREFSIPFDSPKKLDRIIKYQVEPLLPYPVETMIVDHLPAAPERPILTIAVQKETISACIEELRKGKIEPGVVSVDGLALYGLYLRLHDEPSAGAVSIVHVEREGSLVLVIEGRTLALIRLLKGEQPSEIRQTLDLYKVKNPTLNIERVLLTGSGADDHVAMELHKETALDVVPWRPFDLIRHNLGEIDTRTQALFAVPLGLAMGSFAGPLRDFNLRREEFALGSTSKLKGSIIYAAASVVMLMALFTFTTFHSLRISQKDYSGLRSEIHSIFRAACPDVPNIIKGMELEQMRQKILEGTKEYKWLQTLTDRGPVLDVLLVLTRNLSPFKDVKLDNVSVEGNRVDLDGRASSFQTVDNLKGVLERTGFFTQIKLVGAKMDNRDKMVRFNFVMERQV